MTHKYSIADCPGWVPGMALAHNVCENCGGDRYEDHPINKRNGANSVKRHPAQPPAFPVRVVYSCGCAASGDGSAPLPNYCPSHDNGRADDSPIQTEAPEGDKADADGQPGQVPDEQPEGAPLERDAPAGEPGSEA